MAPELVIADTPYKTFPGGVVAIRCADHVDGGSATAASEADTLAHDGDAVRETQQVDDIYVNPGTAYNAAEITLECVGVPLRAGVTYYPSFSYRIEGEGDLTDIDWRVINNNEMVNGGVVMGMDFETNTSFQSIVTIPLPHYRQAFIDFAPVEPETNNPTVYVRVAVESGSTYEVLIDQITFVPNIDTQFPNVGIGDTEIVDGADGGDANGKYTWTPHRGDERHAGGGDFQDKADASTAEWYERIVPDPDFIFDYGGSRHVYGVHGAGYRGARTWAEDTFDNRTTTEDPTPAGAFIGEFGIDPTGYGYGTDSTEAAANNVAYVDGAGNGVMKVRHFQGGVQVNWGSLPTGTATSGVLLNLNHGRYFRLYDQWSWEGKFTYVSDANMTSGNNAVVRLTPFSAGSAGVGDILIQLEDKTWQTIGHGPIDISSWFGEGAQLGWRIEVERYVRRYKVWDASGAEPGAWDFEDYVQIQKSPWLADDEYDYNDNEGVSSEVTDSIAHLRVLLDVTDGSPALSFPLQINLNYMKLTHDPGAGDPVGIGAAFYSPEGNSWGEIDIPWGAAYFVYWGSGVISVEDEFDPGFFYLDYSTKVWNDPGAPSIQRAETVGWVTIGIPVNIVPMNWRSASRKSTSHRILVGS